MKAFCQNCNKERQASRFLSNRLCNNCGCIINERVSTQYYLKNIMKSDQELGL